MRSKTSSRLVQGALALVLTGIAAGPAEANIWNRPFFYNNVAEGQSIQYIDFASSTVAGHYGYDTFNAPSGAGVKFVPLAHYGGGVGRCFDYSFISPAGDPQSDIIMYAKVGSTWTKVSDDTDGLFPRFRVWVGASWLDLDPQGQSLRLSAYSSGTNSAHFIIKRTMIAGTQAYCESTGAVVRLTDAVSVIRTAN